MPDMPALNLNDILDPITLRILVEPMKINCPHPIERLALAKLLRSDNAYSKICPICRAVITTAVPDNDLAKKIQDQFVNVNAANRRTFEKQKRSLAEDPYYNDVRRLPVIPPIEIRRRSAGDYDHLLRFAPRSRVSTDPYTLYTEVQSNIRINNLATAEQVADRISSLSYFHNASYEEISRAHINQAYSTLTHLDNAIRVTNKISNNIPLKNTLFTKISFEYAVHKKYSKAFETIKWIPWLISKFVVHLLVIGTIAIHGVLFVLHKLSWPFRALRNILRTRYR